MFDVVDELDQVIGQAARSVVHREGYLHRAVQIFVFNSAGQLLIQKRSATKDEWPLTWTSSASGHVDAGESYDAAAHRELYEELHLRAELERVARFAATAELANEHTVLYLTSTDHPPRHDPVEIDAIEFVGLDEIERRMVANPRQFAPTFQVMLRWYRSNR